MRAFFVAIGVLWFVGFGVAGVASIITGHAVPMFETGLLHGKVAHFMGGAWLGAAFLSLAYLVLARDFKVHGRAEQVAHIEYWLLGIGLAGSALLEIGRILLNLAP